MTEAIGVYEDTLLRTATAQVLRPGGLDLTDRAVALCELPPGALVVDVGCGAGVTVEHLRTRHRLRALGVDPSAVLLAAGRTRCARLPLLRGRCEQLPVADGSADAVLLECVLSLVDELDPVLAELARVLRPGGRLAVTDLYARNGEAVAELQHLPDGSCLRTSFTQEHLLDRLARAGFLLRRWEDHSVALTRLAVQLLWHNGSAVRSWCAGRAPSDPPALREAVRRARPGYFLLIAQTPGA